MTELETAEGQGGGVRAFPSMQMDEDGTLQARVGAQEDVQALLGMKTAEAAQGVFRSALEALGGSAKDKAQLVSAMFAEIEPRDGIEAMLVAQMTATHVAMTLVASKMAGGAGYQVRESYERSMTRLSRTYLAQMDALKKHRAKAQQVVRVERVTVQDGGQAIVGDVTHGGGGR
ncbi:hypothetical protein PVW46_17320 [Mameliella sp. AT18]|uniref:hypothetical protein n=1 Tax=Mameliella sp. AT18 TaxID=3028385 RepID=UPI00084121FB|nr:hypothetical protein [Mameliella sp. AT18]MDD9731667.1 hypothetical protein [Mameliella sp. AT18]ODM45563.1 hypothetical protein A9320_27635 [Ruegeria sp. PBVC088]